MPAFVTQIRVAQNRTVKQGDDYQKAECEYTIGIPFGDVPVTDKEAIGLLTKSMGMMVESSLTEALQGKNNLPSTSTRDTGKKQNSSADKAAEKALGWGESVMCQGCQATITVQHSKSTGKPWAICKRCGCWLNSDGSKGEQAPANMLK